MGEGEKMEGGGGLVGMCIEAASASRESVEVWRRQRRALERIPSQLADALLRRLIQRRLIYPSLLEVFEHSVEEIDLKGEGCVDAEWMAYLGAFRHLRSLNIADCRRINNSNLWHVTGMDSLKELNLSRCSKITDAGIGHLLSLTNLEKLYISETGLTAAGVVLLSSIVNLRVLDMGGIPVTDEALCSLQVLTELEYLDIWGSKVSNVGARVLIMFPKLSFLNVAWTDVTKLPNLPSITCLNMSNCCIDSIFYGVPTVKLRLSKLLVHGSTTIDVDEAFSNLETSCIKFLDMSRTLINNFNFLANMKGLEHLDLSFSKMTDDLVARVADVGVNLRYLNLSNTEITHKAISVLAGNVKNLETLCLSHTAIDDAALLHIDMMPSLRSIDLSHTRIGGLYYSGGGISFKVRYSLSSFQNLSHLESLNLEDTHLIDEVLHPLASLRELKSLYLKSDFLTDISLHALSSLQKLKHLGLRCAVVSNSGLFSYSPPPVLGSLDLRGCWLLSADSVSQFCKKHPRIEVRHEHIVTFPADQNARGGPSLRYRTTQASEAMRQKGGKLSSLSPIRYPKVIFIDERIKYSREELLELQLPPLLSLSLHDPDVPKMLMKE